MRLLILSKFGFSAALILDAQSLVKRYFNSFSLLLENQICIDDVVEVGGRSGLLEAADTTLSPAVRLLGK